MLSTKNIGVGTRSLIPGLALIAPAFWIAWIELIYSGEITLSVNPPTASDIIIAYIISTTAMGAMLVVYGTFPRVFQPLLQKPWLIIVAGAGAALSTYFTLAMNNFFVTALTGVFTSLLAARFSLLFAQVNPKGALLACCISQIGGSFVYGYVLSLPASWQPVFLCLLPFVAALTTLLVGDFFHEDLSFIVDPPSSSYIRLLVGMLVFSVAINVVRGFYPATIEMNSFAEARGASSVLFFFVKVGLCALIVMLPKNVNLPKLCYFTLLVLAFMTLPLPFFGLGSELTFETFGCINALLNLAFWAMIASLSYWSGRSALRLFGWGWGGMSLGSVAGWALGFALYANGVDGSFLAALDVIMMVVMILCCVFVITPGVIKRLYTPDDPEADVPLVNPGRFSQGADALETIGTPAAASQDVHGPGRWMSAATRMVSDYDISPREADVLISLLKGNTKRHISEELFISYNTVRSHIRSIYTKCDAHNQQDLVDILESYMK